MKNFHLYFKRIFACILFFGLSFAFINNAKAVFATEEALKIIKVGENDVVDDMVNISHIIVGEEIDLELTITGSGTIEVYFSRRPDTCSWLELTSENHLKGTPTIAGTFGINVHAKNEYGDHDILIWLFVYNVEDAPVITTESLPKAYVNSRYYQDIEFTGYNQSFGVSVEGAEWLIGYESGAFGVIEGTPTQAGTYAVTVAIDNGAGIARKTYSIEVLDETLAPEVVISGFEINDEYSSINESNEINVVEGKGVNVQFFATGTNTSTNPLVWSVADGSTLPTGLSFSDDGLLSGTVGTDIVTSGQCKYIYVTFEVYNLMADGVTKQKTSKQIIIVVWKNECITGIEVPSTEITVSRGGKRQLSATVTGYGDFDSGVVWSLGTTNSLNTTIDENGLLTIGLDETKETIIVRVESKADNYYYKLIVATVSDHNHDMKYVPAVKETCTKNGNIAYYVCESCGLKFAEIEAINELTDEQITIPAHHTLSDLIERVEPNCSVEGTVDHYDCTVCLKHFDAEGNELLDISIPTNDDHLYGEWVSNGDGTHSRVCSRNNEHIETVKCSGGTANCQEKAVCEVCNTPYGEYGPHHYSDTWDFKDASGHAHKCTIDGCTQIGTIHAHIPDIEAPTEEQAQKCSECGYIIQPELAHTHHTSLVEGIPATCTTDGRKDYYTCSGCEDKFLDEAGTVVVADNDLVIPAHHSLGDLIPGVDANCTNAGTVAHYDCNDCGKHFDKDGNELSNLSIPVNGNHVLGAWIDEVKATTKNEGVKGHYDCSVCGKHFDVDGNEIIDLAIPQLEKKGISAGAVWGITLGSIAIVGIGGFSVFWFVIRKKKLVK